MGMKGIMTKLMGLKQSVPGMKHNLTTKDCQPITAGNGILVAVTGDIAVNGQVFKFAQVAASSAYVQVLRRMLRASVSSGPALHWLGRRSC